MIRYTPLALVALSLFAGTARAADEPTYGVTANATRTGDKISLSVKLTRTGLGDGPDGKDMITSTMTTPKLTLGDGRRTYMVTGRIYSDDSGKGSGRGDGGGPQAPADPNEITSGCKVDVISIKGSDHLIVIATFVENSLTVWADAITVKIAPEPADAKREQ